MALIEYPKTAYPKNERAVRRFRLWNANEKAHVPHRNYVYAGNAHDGALKEARWAKVGVAIEVYDLHTGKLLGQYKRSRTGLDIYMARGFQTRAEVTGGL